MHSSILLVYSCILLYSSSTGSHYVCSTGFEFCNISHISRCGMVWFSEDVLSLDMIFEHYLSKLKSQPIDEGEEEVRGSGGSSDQETLSPVMQVGLCVHVQ